MHGAVVFVDVVAADGLVGGVKKGHSWSVDRIGLQEVASSRDRVRNGGHGSDAQVRTIVHLLLSFINVHRERTYQA